MENPNTPPAGDQMMTQAMQMVEQMMSQGAQPADVVAQLLQQQMPPEMIMQILVQMGMPEEQAQQIIAQAMQGGQDAETPQEQSTESPAEEIQEEEVPAEEPMMQLGGLLQKKDFMEVRKEMLKKMADGGNVKTELDNTSTEAYISNLRGAIANHIAKSNSIAMVNKRMNPEGIQFAEIPTAAYGDEVTDDQIKAMQKVDPTMTKEKFLGYDEDIRRAWLEPKDPGFTTTKSTTPIVVNNNNSSNNTPNTTEQYNGVQAKAKGKNYWNGKTGWSSRNISEEEYNNLSDDEKKQFQETSSSEYNGVQAQSAQRSLSGTPIDTQKFLMSPIGQLFSSVGPKTATGNVQVRGFGDLQGKSKEELASMLQSGNYGVSAMEDIKRKNIFGQEKRRDTDIFGRSNVIGKRVYFSPTGTQNAGTSTETNQSGSAQTPTGFDSKGRNLDEYLQEMKISRTDYDNNVGGVRDAVNKEFGITSTVQPQNGTVHPNAGNIHYATGDENDRWVQKQQRELNKYFKENPNGDRPAGYMPEYGKMLDQHEQEVIDFAKDYGVTPEDLQNPAIRNAIYDAMEGGTGKFYMNPDAKEFMRFGGNLKRAEAGLETGLDVRPEFQREINFGTGSEGFFGIADSLNNKLDIFRNRTPRSVATAQRSMDSMFDPIAPGSGDSGFYDEMGRFIPNDRGARVLAGTGTDQSVYNQFTNRNLSEDFMTNNVRPLFRNGGLFKAALGDEIELSDDDLKQFEALGYKVKRIG